MDDRGVCSAAWGGEVPLSATTVRAGGCHPHSGMQGLFPCHEAVICLPTGLPSSTAAPTLTPPPHLSGASGAASHIKPPSSPSRCLWSCESQCVPSRHIRGTLSHRRSLRQLSGPPCCAFPLPSPAGRSTLILPSREGGGRRSIIRARARARAGPRGRRSQRLRGSCGPGGLCCEPRGCARRHRPLLHPHAAGEAILLCRGGASPLHLPPLEAASPTRSLGGHAPAAP